MGQKGFKDLKITNKHILHGYVSFKEYRINHTQLNPLKKKFAIFITRIKNSKARVVNPRSEFCGKMKG